MPFEMITGSGISLNPIGVLPYPGLPVEILWDLFHFPPRPLVHRIVRVVQDWKIVENQVILNV